MGVVIAAGLLAAIAGVGLGYLFRGKVGSYRSDTLEQKAKQALKEAKRDAETIRKEARIHAKDEVIKAREEFEKSVKDRRTELDEIEDRLSQREVNLDRRLAMIEKKEHTLDDKLAGADKKTKELEAREAEVKKLAAEEREKIEHVAGMTAEQAKQTLLERVEKDVHSEVGALIRRRQETAKETAEREARNIVALAVERFSGSHASEMLTSTVVLPSDDVKGRIIGREGRNIRALEAATGVNILIDDTPEAVVISGFDPIRREIAKVALENLVADGRIHPARIEEVVAKVQETMDETIRTVGEEAAYDVGIQDVDPELIRKLGRLKYRTSYSQNVLRHSTEVAMLMGSMAGELGLDTSLAKRIGMFHDLGKSMDHEVEGGHAVIGADLLKRHGESPVVVNAVAAHHEEVKPESLYAVLCSAADAISSSRLGARSETTDIYVKRLEKLEEIANGFDGVKKSYAIQAGREIRVLVEPEEVDENSAMVMARDVSKKIESELQYPGQIRIVVVRETRYVEYAR